MPAERVFKSHSAIYALPLSEFLSLLGVDEPVTAVRDAAVSIGNPPGTTEEASDGPPYVYLALEVDEPDV